MTTETTQALEFIKLIADRAIIKGNVFTGTDEVYRFINSFQHLVTVLTNQEKTPAESNGKEPAAVTEKLKTTN